MPCHCSCPQNCNELGFDLRQAPLKAVCNGYLLTSPLVCAAVVQHRWRDYIVLQAPPVPPTCELNALRGPFTRPRRSEVEVVRSSCSLWLLGARRKADTRLAAQKEMLSGALPAGGRPNSLSTRAARWCPLQGRHAAHVRGREQRGANMPSSADIAGPCGLWQA